MLLIPTTNKTIFVYFIFIWMSILTNSIPGQIDVNGYI